MSALLLVSILTAGFILASLHYPSSYKLNRVTGWLPYFIIASHGVVLSLITLLILLCVDYCNFGRVLTSILGIYKKDILQWGFDYKELKLIVWSTSSIMLGSLLGGLSKWYYSDQTIKNKRLRVLTKDNHFEKVIINNIEENMLSSSLVNSVSVSCVAISLRSGKVYVGWFEDVSLEKGVLTDFTITPTLSGYRSKEKHKLKVEVNYLEHFECDPRYKDTPQEVFKDYKVTIMKDQVDYLSLFDSNTYKKFNVNSESKPIILHL